LDIADISVNDFAYHHDKYSRYGIFSTIDISVDIESTIKKDVRVSIVSLEVLSIALLFGTFPQLNNNRDISIIGSRYVL
jgi:hypothetical protein